MSEVSQKQLVAGKKNSVQKKYTPEETKNKVLELFRTEGDLNNNLQELGDDIFPKLFHGGKKEQKMTREVMYKKVTEVLMALETDSHWGLMGSFNPEYRGFVKEFGNQLIKDYGCQTIAEKALVGIIANAYIRVIDNSRRLNNDLGGPGQPITENKTKYLSMLSIQIDRANRQFLNALVTLKQLKAPNIEMNVKAKTAFIAQNQQINAGDPPKSTNNETDEPK